MNTVPSLQILAISGSLRAGSSNTTLLRATEKLAPPDVFVQHCDAVAALPHFNLDLDNESPPPSVQGFRAQLKACDGALICSPEYAHGVPGSLKNALDWMVSSGEFMGKPVALLNASTSASHAQSQLQETLSVMMAQVVPNASLRVPLSRNSMSVEEMLQTPAIADVLRASLDALLKAISEGKSESL